VAAQTAGVSCAVPLRTYSEANTRAHWTIKAKRAREQRGTIRILLWHAVAGWRNDKARSFIVTLTRVAPRRCDTDNLARSLKAVRDGVADALGIDDGSLQLCWRYAQVLGLRKEYAVQVQIEIEAVEKNHEEAIHD